MNISNGFKYLHIFGIVEVLQECSFAASNIAFYCHLVKKTSHYSAYIYVLAIRLKSQQTGPQRWCLDI